MVLKSSISTNYYALISLLTNVDDMIKAIYKFKYPAKDHVKYMSQLSKIKENNYLRISEFEEEIIKTTRKLSICLDWGEEMQNNKINEAFYYGLSKRTQLEMTRLNVHDINSMFKLIDETEATIIEQIKDIPNNTNRKYNKASYNVKNKHKKPFFNFHQTNSHDKSNCRALKRSHIESSSKHDSNNNEKINTFIREPKIKSQLIELETKFITKTINSFLTRVQNFLISTKK
ncbi:hypothetical protein EQH57_0227 [Dictyocoela roeselum]|nr:hypothetical protein EQH57_0227 [Dictyocoela roeselum]